MRFPRSLPYGRPTRRRIPAAVKALQARHANKPRPALQSQRPDLPLDGTYLIYRYDPKGGACIGKGRVIEVTHLGEMTDRLAEKGVHSGPLDFYAIPRED